MPLVRLPDGRDLEYEVQGPNTGPVVLFHHGMPGSAVPMDTVLGSMTERGFRIITYSRAGYGAEGLDYIKGMGAQNVAQFGMAGHGEPAMRELVGQMASAVRGHASADVATEMASLLPPVDLAVLTAEFGADNAATMDHGLSRGDEGWIADLAALTSPWGFDLDAVTAPIELWHGTVDRMVPVAHGQWLAEHLPTAVPHLEPGQGHLSLAIGSLGEKLEVLRGRVADRATPTSGSRTSSPIEVA